MSFKKLVTFSIFYSISWRVTIEPKFHSVLSYFELERVVADFITLIYLIDKNLEEVGKV